jgi:hypothetical protein
LVTALTTGAAKEILPFSAGVLTSFLVQLARATPAIAAMKNNFFISLFFVCYFLF